MNDQASADAGVLQGIRVLDFGRYIAGPFCAALLGDLGADVIRIERPGGGEDRDVYPVSESGDGALYLQCNRNKRSMMFDVKAHAGGEAFRRLVASADVVVANMPAPALRELKLDYDSLRAIRPDIILTSIAAFGHQGPQADGVGFDGVGQAMSGAPFLSGFEQPTKSFASWVDMMSAMSAAFATMAAIHERARSGKGQEVRTSLLGAALTVMNFPLIEQSLTGVSRERTGNRAQSGSPADFFKTKDGWIAVQVIGNPLFKRWARLVGADDWVGDPRFADDAARAENGALLSERMGAWTVSRSSDEALAALAGARIPAGPVLSPEGALQHPQVASCGVWENMAFPGTAASVPLTLRAADLSRTGPQLYRRAPLAGEHTEEIVRELGLVPSALS
jgi:crotonobetainyl-CoA:carnitine CoA-transferase CaiB-like acyl-CoA transferase